MIITNLFNVNGDQAKEDWAEIYKKQVDILLEGFYFEVDTAQLDNSGSSDIENMITGTGLKITHKNISLIFQLITTSHFHKVGKDPLVVVDERSYVVQAPWTL